MKTLIKNILSIGLALLIVTCMTILLTNHNLISEQYLVLAITMSVASILFLTINKTTAK